MPLYLIDLEQCPESYRTNLLLLIKEEIQSMERVKQAFEDYKEIESRKEEYQDTINYISYLNKILNKLKELVNYDCRII